MMKCKDILELLVGRTIQSVEVREDDNVSRGATCRGEHGAYQIIIKTDGLGVFIEGCHDAGPDVRYCHHGLKVRRDLDDGREGPGWFVD